MVWRIVLVTGCLATTAAAQAPESATARTEKRLAELLTPGVRAADAPAHHGPAPRLSGRPAPPLEAPLPRANVAPPALPAVPAKAIAPRPAHEDVPLVRSFGAPQLPQAIEFATGPLLRLWSEPVNEPLPVPILGTGVRDRAALGDPSLEASVAATQTAVSVTRTQPVPFQPHNLPNPFEHAEAVRVRTPHAELPTPALTPRPLAIR